MFATALQLAGLALVIAGGLLVSVPFGIVAFGAVCTYIGLAADRSR